MSQQPEVDLEVLRRARIEALDADHIASEKESAARHARRTATAKMRHYELLVSQYQGQLTIEDA